MVGAAPSSALQQNSGYLAQQPPSALGVPLPPALRTGYSQLPAVPATGLLSTTSGPAGRRWRLFSSFKLWGPARGLVLRWLWNRWRGPGPYPPPQPHYGNEQTGSFAPSVLISSPRTRNRLRVRNEHSTAQTFDWMKVKRNPPKTGRAQDVATPSLGAQSSSAAFARRCPGWAPACIPGRGR